MLVAYSDLLATTVWLSWWDLSGAHLLSSEAVSPLPPHTLPPLAMSCVCVCGLEPGHTGQTAGRGHCLFVRFSVPLRVSWAAHSAPETPHTPLNPSVASTSVSPTIFLTQIHTLTPTPPHMTDEQAIASFQNEGGHSKQVAPTSISPSCSSK